MKLTFCIPVEQSTQPEYDGPFILLNDLEAGKQREGEQEDDHDEGEQDEKDVATTGLDRWVDGWMVRWMDGSWTVNR